jgi:hypothetical protein
MRADTEDEARLLDELMSIDPVREMVDCDPYDQPGPDPDCPDVSSADRYDLCMGYTRHQTGSRMIRALPEDREAALRQVLAWYLERHREDRVSVQRHSALRLNVRFPRSMHVELSARAAREGVSANTFIIAAVARLLGNAS